MGGKPKAKRWKGAEFGEAMAELIAPGKLAAVCEEHAPVARRGPKLKAEQVVTALVYHQLQPAGTLAAHGAELHGVKMSESAYAQRRQGLPLRLFEEMMTEALRPLADARRQPECFWQGWRVVGIDGTEWNVTNAPAIAGQLPKAATRRLQAAFAKLRLVTAVELGTHQPLAAVAAPVKEGEASVAAKLWARLPDHSLVVLDRLFGSPWTLWQAQTAWQGRPMAFLARVKANLKVRRQEELAEGSAIVTVPVVRERRPIGELRLREIHAEGRTAQGRRFRLRFWTNLLDPVAYPAEALARHYVERWEHELYYRELKLDVRGSDVLASHTVETALQELAALVLATAVVARARVAAAEALGVPPRRVSFLKVLLATRQLWQAFAWGAGTLTPTQRRLFADRCLAQIISTALLPERRARSCPRVVRQPLQPWPRKLSQPSSSGRSIVHLVRLP